MTAQKFYKLIDLVLFGSLTMAMLTGCPDNKDGSESDPGPARQETSGGEEETGPKPQI